jgi:SAM-dependent methyltransferase
MTTDAMVSRVISGVRELMPWAMRRAWRGIKRRVKARGQARKPRGEVFAAIYRENVWGKSPKGETCYSGPGSDDAATGPYVDAVRRFIAANEVRSVVDIGCGDFRVGRRLLMPGVAYTGVDIVEDVIVSNAAAFGGVGAIFRCLDVVDGEPPAADLCLIRQVFQHLSNEHIGAVLQKLGGRYKWAIITEDQPGAAESFKPNKNIPTGSASRIAFGSGIVLDAPPFNLPSVSELVEVAAPHQSEFRGGRIVSFLVDCRLFGQIRR